MRKRVKEEPQSELEGNVKEQKEEDDSGFGQPRRQKVDGPEAHSMKGERASG